jgi:hypothetical protein
MDWISHLHDTHDKIKVLTLLDKKSDREKVNNSEANGSKHVQKLIFS